MSESKIRVAIADDEPTVRAALADLVADEPAFELVGTASDTDEAIGLTLRERPDVVLLDVRMPGGGGQRAAQEIRASCPSTRVVALSAYEDRGTVLEILRAGAVGYLVKGTSGREILDAIHRAARGQGILSSEVTADVLDELAGQLERRERGAARRRAQIERVRAILERPDRLAIHLQPIVDLASGEVVGTEALARFDGDPPRPPDVWFSEAKAIGLAQDLELAAVRTALRTLPHLPQHAFLSVNVSPDVASTTRFLEILDGAATERVVIEVTEHVQVEDYEELSASLREVRALGARLAIDDAGAGYASLRHILQLSPDFIKIDITLTRGIDGDSAKRALAAALITFASEIGAQIIAEGIETLEELRTLRELGVGLGQGYFLAKPAPPQPGGLIGRVPILGSTRD